MIRREELGSEIPKVDAGAAQTERADLEMEGFVDAYVGHEY